MRQHQKKCVSCIIFKKFKEAIKCIAYSDVWCVLDDDVLDGLNAGKI